MRIYTVRDVEDVLIDNLYDLRDSLINHRLECDVDQAVVLLHKFEQLQEELLMMLSPTERYNVN